MIIEIDPTKTIDSLRIEFAKYYPFLKLELFDKAHSWQEASPLDHILNPGLLLGEIRKIHPGAIEIQGWQKTGSVEQAFKKQFGLNVQIFRRHGENWVQTVGTDELSLSAQNEIGQHATEDQLHGTDRKTELEKLL